MKRSNKYRCCILAILIFCFFITSCSINIDNYKGNNKKTNVVIIAGIHSNSEKMNMCSEEEIRKLFSDLGKVRVIVADGNPELAVGANQKYIGEYNEQYLAQSEEVKQDNKDIWERDYLPEQTQSFIEELKKLKPDDPEVNTLEAIFEAVNVLNGFSQKEDEKNKANKEIIIYDTGVCTSGGFSFTNSEWADMLFCDKELKDKRIQTMIESLKSQKLIPNLSDIKVTWYGIGKTAKPQTKLEANHIDNLKRIWWSILKEAEAIPPNETGEYDYFFQVESQGRTNYSQSVTVISNYKNKIETRQTKKISAEKLGFRKESSKFISKEKAMSILKPYAKNILRFPNENILLVGTTADPKRQGGSVSLSKKRAEKVKKYLVKLGVPNTQMKILGWGARAPLYNPREWVDNSFIENVAKENRAVYLMSEKSEMAQELLKSK